MCTNFEIYSNFNHKKAHTHFAVFEKVIIKISHFYDFEQVIIKISHFADFEQELPCVTGTPLQLLRLVSVSTSSELYPNTGFFECPDIFAVFITPKVLRHIFILLNALIFLLYLFPPKPYELFRIHMFSFEYFGANIPTKVL